MSDKQQQRTGTAVLLDIHVVRMIDWGVKTLKALFIFDNAKENSKANNMVTTFTLLCDYAVYELL